MRIRRRGKLLVEPPTSATGDIAFNLIVFFLVCASIQPSRGREQEIPRTKENPQKQESENIEVVLTRTAVIVNGTPVLESNFRERLRALLANRQRKEDKVVVVKNKPEVPYDRWIRFTGWIEDAGGDYTLQIEEERKVVVP